MEKIMAYFEEFTALLEKLFKLVKDLVNSEGANIFDTLKSDDVKDFASSAEDLGGKIVDEFKN